MEKMSPIIHPVDLVELMGIGQFVLVDARSGVFAKENYEAVHLKNALFADLEEDLANTQGDPANGGRHPLPEISHFTAFLGRLGIDPDTRVVVYDDKGGANAAARFWWMMRAVGHEKIQVLDGGMEGALNHGIGLVTKPSVAQPKPPYPADRWLLPVVDADTVAKAAADPEAMVIDVREPFRYRGDSEPIDIVAGHIPGAVNFPFSYNLNSFGFFHSRSTLEKSYKRFLNGKDPSKVIVHCGSGVTACHTLLAMEIAGFPIPSLYVGSWSEWSRNDRPVGKSSTNIDSYF